MKYFYVAFAAICLFSSSSYAGLTDKECDEIWEKYQSFVVKLGEKEDINAHIAGISELLEKASYYRELIQNLNITYTMEEIRENFDKYGVLLLRPFNGKKLLLGCGNRPVDPVFATYSRHEHDEYDTVNPQISMNPTLIAAFGLNDLRGLLPDAYEELAFEAFTPIKTTLFSEAFKYHCSHVKDIFDIENFYGKDDLLKKEHLESIDKIFSVSNWPGESSSEESDEDKSSCDIYDACNPYHSDDDKSPSAPRGIDYSEYCEEHRKSLFAVSDEDENSWDESFGEAWSSDDEHFLSVPWGIDYSEDKLEQISSFLNDSLANLHSLQEE